MGMSVNGLNPRSETGNHFFMCIGWWHGLWEFCCRYGSGIIDEKTAKLGNVNDGAGLNNVDSVRLATVLQKALDAGEADINNIKLTTGWYAAIIEGVKMGELTKNLKTDTAKVPFDKQDVIDFIAFLKDCGGFEIK